MYSQDYGLYTIDGATLFSFDGLVSATPILQQGDVTHREQFDSVFRLPAFECNRLRDRNTGASTSVWARPTMRVASAIRLGMHGARCAMF